MPQFQTQVGRQNVDTPFTSVEVLNLLRRQNQNMQDIEYSRLPVSRKDHVLTLV